MSRPLRIEYPGAFYRVMNRGAGRKNIYVYDEHRLIFLELLREVHEMFKVEIHACCLMDNHYHFLLSTPLDNLCLSNFDRYLANRNIVDEWY